MMSIFSVFSFIAFFCYVYFGFYGRRKAPASSVNRMFFVWCMLMALWSFAYIFFFQSTNQETAFLWDQIAALGWAYCSAAGLHFLLLISHNGLVRQKGILALIYLPGTIELIFEIFFLMPAGNSHLVSVFFFVFDQLYMLTYSFLMIIILYIWQKRSVLLREKAQAELLLRMASTCMVLVLCNTIFQLLYGYDRIPFLNNLFLLLLLYASWQAITKYGMLKPQLTLVTRDVLELVTDLIVLFDTDGIIMEINRSAERVLRFQNKNIYGCHIENILQNYSQEDFTEKYLNKVTDTYLQDVGGNDIPIRMKVFPIRDVMEDIIGYTCIGRDMRMTRQLEDEIQERKAMERQLLYMSMHDPVTGLYNRASFEHEMGLVGESEKKRIGILVADIDGLKLVNDNLGHIIGDRLLIDAGDILATSLRRDDKVFRIGGDEFAILLPNIMEEECQRMLERIDEKIAQVNQESNAIPVQLSMGWEVGDISAVTVHDIFRIADNNMYKNKSMRRDAARQTIQSYIDRTKGKD